LDGLLNRIPAPNQGAVSGAAAANAADRIFAAMTTMRDSFLEPDGVMVNPADWGGSRLLKDQQDNYIGGSPFGNGAAQRGRRCGASGLW
jgi:hypothetical protein